MDNPISTFKIAPFRSTLYLDLSSLGPANSPWLTHSDPISRFTTFTGHTNKQTDKHKKCTWNITCNLLTTYAISDAATQPNNK